MKFSKNLLLLTNLLAVSASHYVKRDFTNTKFEIYKNIIPNSLEKIAQEATDNNRIMKLTKHEVEFTGNFAKLDKGKYMKTVADDPFNLNVHCYTTKDCRDYPDKVQEGAYYVAQALEFYNPVNVNVTIFPFCSFINDKNNCKSIMGITYPPLFVPLKQENDEEPFLYPQALVKQLDIDSEIQYEEMDFLVYLNSDYYPDPSQDNRALIAAHEILHGLGFFHQINPVSVYINNYSNYFENDFALPPIDYEESDTTIRYKGWTPFSIFDKFLVGTGNPTVFLYKKLLKYKTHDINFEISINRPTTKQYNDFMQTFRSLENDEEANVGGVEVARLFSTLNAVGFHTKDGEVVELQTFDGSYESASSISHTNVPFACKNSSTCNVSNASITQNYLMYFTVISRASTSKLIKTFKNKSKHELIGDDIVKIMCTLGWNERNGDNNSSNGNSYTYSTSDARHIIPSYILTITSFIFFCITRFI